ncbi:MAG: hypothetical protein IPP94_10120 [Ignavibacteria bacterium]|nr:hypothetical protein [Ignavibacteria bacterium]
MPRRRARGQVLGGVDADAMLSFRKKVGIGKLLRDIADNPDISFVTLQDMDGILAASTSVTSMVAIEDDPFLAEAWHADSSRTRVIDSGDAPLLEVVRSLRLEDGSHVLTRVGLRLDNVRRIQQRGLQRLAIIAAAMFAGGIALLLLMTTRKRFSALREEHALVKSEQERIAAQLERRDRLTAMGALASGIAHEIRNPLNAISMIVQRFRTEFQPAEDVEEYRQLADTMRSEVQRVNGIVTQFLEFARPPKLDLQPARLADIVRRAADVVDSEARHAGITVALDLQESPAPCLIDVPRMQQALLNLFQNALQSMRSGGTLAVSLRVTHRACILTVRDSGCGIPRETLPNIFNLYFTTKQGGSGLGLSVVHQIIAEHRGEIAVESTVGTGTTFTITLPGS